MDAQSVIDTLVPLVSGASYEVGRSIDFATIYVPADKLVETCRALRDLGWSGLYQILTFFLILLVGYVYVWRKGVLDWGPAVRRIRRPDQQQRAA